MNRPLGTINGVAVISAARVPWKQTDDEIIRRLCDSRGLVLFDGGGKSDAICIGDTAIIWEKQGERFRAFPLPPFQRPRTREMSLWQAGMPSSEIGSVVRVEMNDRVTPDHPDGAAIELVALGTIRYRAPMTHRSLRSLITLVGSWPGMAWVQ